MNAKLVEAVARAQYEFFGRAWRLKWDELAPKGQKTMYRECARAALAAIEAEGCRVVPVEPTVPCPIWPTSSTEGVSTKPVPSIWIVLPPAQTLPGLTLATTGGSFTFRVTFSVDTQSAGGGFCTETVYVPAGKVF